MFHYEPIWHWRDLKARHDHILTAIQWIEPEVLKLLPIDRFSKIYEKGPQDERMEATEKSSLP